MVCLARARSACVWRFMQSVSDCPPPQAFMKPGEPAGTWTLFAVSSEAYWVTKPSPKSGSKVPKLYWYSRPNSVPVSA